MKLKTMCLLMIAGLLLIVDIPVYWREVVVFRSMPYMWINGLVRVIGAVLLLVFCTQAVQLMKSRYMKVARNCVAGILTYYIVYTILCFLLEVVQIQPFVELYPLVYGHMYALRSNLSILEDITNLIAVGIDILQFVMICFLLSAGVECGGQRHGFQVLRRCYIIVWILYYVGFNILFMQYGGREHYWSLIVWFLLPYALNLGVGIAAVRFLRQRKTYTTFADLTSL